MVKYNNVKAIWTSPACPCDGIYMDRIYSIFKKNGKLYITDGNAEIAFDEFCITNFLSPKDNDIIWKDVDFSDEVKQSKSK
jgi:hypothetical protein